MSQAQVGVIGRQALETDNYMWGKRTLLIKNAVNGIRLFSPEIVEYHVKQCIVHLLASAKRMFTSKSYFISLPKTWNLVGLHVMRDSLIEGQPMYGVYYTMIHFKGKVDICKFFKAQKLQVEFKL